MSRAPVPGMVDRVFWLNHTRPEDPPSRGSANPNSSSNVFEVEMVAGLVNHLVSSNEYDFKDITVLTPYNGQLAAFAERFKTICSLWLSEDDKEALIMEGYLDPLGVPDGQTVLEVGNMLKLATIDNFQGEESRVVILSTVRSNAEGKVGFLKTNNRINVGCSRARDGFYIVGNAQLMGQVPMWRQIIDELSSNYKIGPQFRICCPRHRSKTKAISMPDQWYTIPDCQATCNFSYPCGHKCNLPCHAEVLHERQGCSQPCERLHQPCGHPCSKKCGEPCGECTNTASFVILQCGHEATLTCGNLQNRGGSSESECQKVIGSRRLPCGHKQEIICSAPDKVDHCRESCGASLPCGHK